MRIAAQAVQMAQLPKKGNEALEESRLSPFKPRKKQYILRKKGKLNQYSQAQRDGEYNLVVPRRTAVPSKESPLGLGEMAINPDNGPTKQEPQNGGRQQRKHQQQIPDQPTHTRKMGEFRFLSRCSPITGERRKKKDEGRQKKEER